MRAFLLGTLFPLAVVAAAQPEMTAPTPGPFSLRGSKLWHLGPFRSGDSFEVRAAQPFGRAMVLKGTNTVLNYVQGTQWTPIFFPESFGPGFVLPPGTYGFSAGGDNYFVWGYYAPPGTTAGYSGWDEYPSQGRIWSFHPVLNGTDEFSVPADRVYVLTFLANEAWMLKFEKNQWRTFLPRNFGSYITLPGIRLGPGRYRLVNPENSFTYCGGYITTEY